MLNIDISRQATTPVLFLKRPCWQERSYYFRCHNVYANEFFARLKSRSEKCNDSLHMEIHAGQRD